MTKNVINGSLQTGKSTKSIILLQNKNAIYRMKNILFVQLDTIQVFHCSEIWIFEITLRE